MDIVARVSVSAMSYRFDPFELDAECFELRRSGAAIAVEPQVLSLLVFLIANRARMVTKDEIVDAIWHGRIVSDAAISSRVKSARHAIGDNGSAQRLIRTIHGRGFRFVGDVQEVGRASPVTVPNPSPVEPARPSIAVLPLGILGDAGPQSIVAEALPQEIIRELSRLRWLFVIARGSSFRFDTTHDLSHIGDVLGVRYVLTGTLESTRGNLAIHFELADARDVSVVWAERYVIPADAVHDVRAEVVSRVVAALDSRIPLHEADCARTKAPDCLDAWSAYHLGLQRMFRFTPEDNVAASCLFSSAVASEPTFARAHAGLSFTRFQDAFLDYSDADAASAGARAAAEQAVALDPLDAFANAALGRAHWLSGEIEGGLAWLERSIELSPNYAQGTYARAWAQTLLGRGDEGQRDADRAMALSPLDPLHYAMLATRALSHLVRDERAEAADWAERAAREPGAHALIEIIAAACHGANGDDARARHWVAGARRRQPQLSRARFFRSFPFADRGLREQLSHILAVAGL